MAEIHNAIRNKNLRRVKEILNQNPNALNHKLKSLLGFPLVTAMNTRNQPIINFLLSKNLSQNHLNAALMHEITASKKNSTVVPSTTIGMIRRLLNKGANPRTQIIKPWTPLTYTVSQAYHALVDPNTQQNIVRELVNRGGLPNAHSAQGRQALRSAIQKQKLPVVQILLAAGVPINQAFMNIPTTNQIRNALQNTQRRRAQNMAIVALANPRPTSGLRRTNNVGRLDPNQVRQIMRLAGL